MERYVAGAGCFCSPNHRYDDDSGMPTCVENPRRLTYAVRMTETPVDIEVSIVAPAHNEEDNVDRLIAEIVGAMEPTAYRYEIIIVDDGSTDQTAARLQACADVHPELQIVQMTQTPPGRGHGQSAAFHAGFRASRGRVIVVLDADLQNDPADIPAMLDRLHADSPTSERIDMVQGDRSHARRDTFVRRMSSVVGRTFRRWLLGDTIRDTGCSLRAMRRCVALDIPLQFRGMHRFIPITARQLGYRVEEMQVNHRPRTAGVAKYGIWNRALPGLIDCFAVRWMHRRRRPVTYRMLTGSTTTMHRDDAQAVEASR